MARVELAGVSKVYPGSVVALEPLDLVVNDEELVVLVGPSGSGKTTILRLVAGLERPTAGQIRIDGRVVTGLSPHQRDVAYLAQSCPLYPHWNVFDNIAFGGGTRHAATFLTQLWLRMSQSRAASPEVVTQAWSHEAVKSRVQAAAGKLGIGHLLERRPQQLSGGERQRVALARAIVREPAAFLFDEPLSSLDALLRSQLRQELSQLHKELGKPTLYVTHDQVEALALAERLVVLDRGRVQQSGPPGELYDRPQNRFVASFLGFPPMNLLAGKVQQIGKSLGFVAGNWQLELSTHAAEKLATYTAGVELGVCPEQVELLPTGRTNLPTSATVALVEFIGESRLVYVQQDSQRLVAKVAADAPWAVGQTLAWQAEWSKLHWFDRGTGQRIDL